MPDGVANYPRPLHALVEAHGDEEVYHMGLFTLGYPPTWADTPAECLAVIRAVQAGKNRGH